MDEGLKKQQIIYDRTWQDALQADKEQHGNLQANLTFLDDLPLLTPGTRVLEIGCGVGTIVHRLTAQGCCAVGVDIAPSALEYGRQKYPGVDLHVGPAEQLPFAHDSFDVVLSFDLLEHVGKVNRHLAEVRRILRAGGHYLFQTPNKLSNMIFETCKTRSFRWRRYHPSLQSPRQLRRLMARHQFQIRFTKVNTINQFTLRKIARLGPLAALIKNFDTRRLPLSLQTNLYVIARKQ